MPPLRTTWVLVSCWRTLNRRVYILLSRNHSIEIHIKSLPSYNALNKLVDQYPTKSPLTHSSSLSFEPPLLVDEKQNTMKLLNMNSFKSTDMVLTHSPSVNRNHNEDNMGHVYEDELYINLYTLCILFLFLTSCLALHSNDGFYRISKLTLPQCKSLFLFIILIDSVFSVLKEGQNQSNTYLYLNADNCEPSLTDKEQSCIPFYLLDSELNSTTSMESAFMISASKFYHYSCIPIDCFIYKYIHQGMSISSFLLSRWIDSLLYVSLHRREWFLFYFFFLYSFFWKGASLTQVYRSSSY